MNLKPVILLGAGFSIPAGMPSTAEITERALSGEGFARNSLDRFHIDAPIMQSRGLPDEWVPRIVKFLSVLRAELEPLIDGALTYEHFRQFLQSLRPAPYSLSHIESVIAEKFKHLLEEREDIKELLNHPFWPEYGPSSINTLIDYSREYVFDVTWRMLNKPPTGNMGYLDKFLKSLVQSSPQPSHVFTLNHDWLLEFGMQGKGIEYCDGFVEQSDGLWTWQPDSFAVEDMSVNIYHLHGSILWYWYQVGEKIGYYNKLARVPIPDWHRTLTTPTFLVGGDSKLADYQLSPYVDTFWHLYRVLERSERMLVIGYSFKDLGVNAHVLRWLHKSPSHRLTIIDPTMELHGQLSSFHEAGQLKVVPNGVEEIDDFEHFILS